jgi:hypothetical protein
MVVEAGFQLVHFARLTGYIALQGYVIKIFNDKL